MYGMDERTQDQHGVTGRVIVLPRTSALWMKSGGPCKGDMGGSSGRGQRGQKVGVKTREEKEKVGLSPNHHLSTTGPNGAILFKLLPNIPIAASAGTPVRTSR